MKEKPCIEFIQENSIEFLVQSFLPDTRLIVCTTLNLAYSKGYIYYMCYNSKILQKVKETELLWFNNLRVDQKKKPYIRINTGKLNGVLGTIYLLW